jgi:FKBP-type peptidyl-prolyl cis-trans isomerase FklB
MKALPLIVVTAIALSPFARGAEPEKKPPQAPKPSPAAAAPDQPIGPLKTQKDKVSYSIGLDIGTTLKRQLIDVDPALLQNGLTDGLNGKKPLMTDEQVKETMATFQKEMMAKQTAAKKEQGEKNETQGKKFLEENKKKEGWKTTASGLQYKVLKEGKGAAPKETDTVKVNYRGTTIDGTEFDSSYKRGQPATFPVNRVIKGWTEALQLMKPGAKYQLAIPSDLAYGERGAGSDIGPNSTLLFDVELLETVQPTPTPKPAAYDSSRPEGQPGAAKPIPVKPAAPPAPAAGAKPTTTASPSRE